MNKEDNTDAIKFYVKQKQIDEMREYTKDYGRDQFLRALVDQRTEIAYLRQTLNEIREYCNSQIENSETLIERLEGTNSFRIGNAKSIITEFKNILQIIDKYMKED